MSSTYEKFSFDEFYLRVNIKEGTERENGKLLKNLKVKEFF